jgi:SAM-dependent methyltransferase
MSNRFYDDGLRYDRLYSRQADDIAFYTRQAAEAGGEILELACGTGRVAIPLAQAGFRVTGIDLAGTMLAVARTEAQQKGVEVTWVEGDIRAFALNRRFSMAFIAVNSICHLLTLADFEACMRCVRSHLLPEGRFVVSVFVPNLEILLRSGDVRSPFGDYAAPDGSGTVSLTERHVYAPDTQINHIDIFHELPDGPALVADLEMRMYFPQELDALLKYNGFAVEHKYGTYDGRPFDAESTQQVVVCRVTGDR